MYFNVSSSSPFDKDNNPCSKKEKLNGIDLDWEQPTSKEEYIAYIHLIIEASELFHENRLLLSIALHPGQFLPKEVYNFVDRVHLMTYDMIYSNSHEPSTYNHHATYEKSKWYLQVTSVLSFKRINFSSIIVSYRSSVPICRKWL